MGIRFLYHLLLEKQQEIQKLCTYQGIPALNASNLKTLEIPRPPLSIQEEIVRVLDKFTELETELDCRKKQYEFYRDKLLTFEDTEKVEFVKLGEVISSLKTGLNPRKFFKLNTSDARNYYITIREIQNGRIVCTENTDLINDEALALCNKRSNLEKGDVLFSGTGTIGVTYVITETPTNWNIKEGIYSIKPIATKLNSSFLSYLLNSPNIKANYMKKVAGGIVKSIPMAELKKLSIPLPPLSTQEEIVNILDKFDTLTTSISEGLPKEIALRRKQYEYYRDRLLTFKRKTTNA